VQTETAVRTRATSLRVVFADPANTARYPDSEETAEVLHFLTRLIRASFNLAVALPRSRRPWVSADWIVTTPVTRQRVARQLEDDQDLPVYHSRLASYDELRPLVVAAELRSPFEVVAAIPPLLCAVRYVLGSLVTLAERIATFGARTARDRAMYEAEADAFRAALPVEERNALDEIVPNLAARRPGRYGPTSLELIEDFESGEPPEDSESDEPPEEAQT
jgi:hypothetical protein